MKKIILLLLSIVSIVLCLASCEQGLEDVVTKPTFEFKLNEDKESYTLAKFNGTEKEITIPAEYMEKPVTVIGKEAFLNNEKIKSVLIPDSVKTIEERAFQGCSYLATVELGNGVTEIDYCAFGYCNRLVNITLREGITSIGEKAFYNCISLNSITIPGSIKRIKNNTFDYCVNLQRVTIGQGITSIGNQAFSGCRKLTEVIIPSTVTIIESGAFECCRILYDIVIPDSVTTVESEAFCSSGIEKIEISKNLTDLSYDAFSKCSSLKWISVDEENPIFKSIDGNLYLKNASESAETLVSYARGSDATEFVIPDNVTKIIPGAFDHAKNLLTITIGKGITEIESGVFRGTTELDNIIIPDHISRIGAEAFYSCPRLKTVVIGKGVIEIGDSAFENCFGLESIIIGDGVKKIGENAFLHCSRLRDVVLPSGIVSIGYVAFGDCGAMEYLYFKGNQEQWENMPITPECGDGLYKIDIYYYSESEPVEEGIFWHYDEQGKPALW